MLIQGILYFGGSGTIYNFSFKIFSLYFQQCVYILTINIHKIVEAVMSPDLSP